jgi:hypothetical protein
LQAITESARLQSRQAPENPSVLAAVALCNVQQSLYESFAMQFSRQLA